VESGHAIWQMPALTNTGRSEVLKLPKLNGS